MNDAKKSAIAKLAKMGLTEEEVLALFEDEEETIVAEDGESSGGESKSWQQLVMEEHVGYYNKRYNTNLTFDEYYEGVGLRLARGRHLRRDLHEQGERQRTG